MDIEYLLMLQELREATAPYAEQFFAFVSSVLVGGVMLAIPMVVYWCLDKRKGFAVLLGFSLATAVTNVVKSIICVPRPWTRDARLLPSQAAIDGATGYSFPSGHSQMSMSVYGGAGWEFREKSKAALFFGGLIAALVAFSRNFLGYHTPQDVCAGILMAALFIWATGRILPWLEEAGPRQAIAVMLACIGITVVCLVYIELKELPGGEEAATSMVHDVYESLGLFCGMAIGWWLERSYVGFSVEGSRSEKLARFVVGIVIVLALRYGIASPLGALVGESWKEFLKSFLPVIAGVAGVPATFPAIKRLVNGDKRS